MQTTDTVLMIEPVAFGFNEQTAANNYFQTDNRNKDTQKNALEEFHQFVEILRSKGIHVITVTDTPEPHTPDSIFPNNWVSFGSDGTVILYPMFAPNRRAERRMDILDFLKGKGFEMKKIIDLSHYENEGRFLEGTGSIIFDHDNRIAYGSVSQRLDESLFRRFCNEFQYESVAFHSYQNHGLERVPIYHTNVMMSVADAFAIVCLDAIDDASEREKVIYFLERTQKEIIDISETQLHHFAGNMLQLRNGLGERFLVMSQTAYQSLTQEQIERIEMYNQIIYADLHTIEQNGGGSARCMLAEVFLPKKQNPL